MKKVIYDVGANTGVDIPYYLLKSDLVVAIDANPELCDKIRSTYAAEINRGTLVVECCVVTAEEGLGEVDFYIHNLDHGHSQFSPPASEYSDQYTRTILPSKSLRNIIDTYGSPYYIKIDVEYYDAYLLKALFDNNIHPPFISAESHTIEVFSLLSGQGQYNAFKLVDGPTLCNVYSNRTIRSELTNEEVIHSFPLYSAGPFGDDVDGEWMSAETFLKLLALQGLGWKDIHATNILNANYSFQPKLLNSIENTISRDELLSYLDRKLSLPELLMYVRRRINVSLATRSRSFLGD